MIAPALANCIFWTNACMVPGRAVLSAVYLHHSSGRSFHLLHVCIGLSTYLYRTSPVQHSHRRLHHIDLGYHRPCEDNTVFQPYSLSNNQLHLPRLALHLSYLALCLSSPLSSIQCICGSRLCLYAIRASAHDAVLYVCFSSLCSVCLQRSLERMSSHHGVCMLCSMLSVPAHDFKCLQVYFWQSLLVFLIYAKHATRPTNCFAQLRGLLHGTCTGD